MQFCEKLKKLRAEKGVSQNELAEKIYVSRSAVAKWENGLGLPSGESLALLAEFFGVDKSELLSDPETATVIISKNNTLSKQKLWITILVLLSCVLVIVAAILIPLALRKPDPNPGTDTGTPLEPVRTQELIFETEKNIADLDAKNYSDNNISADKYFAPTRIFTYTSRSTAIILPKILLKTTVADEISYENARNLTCTVSENCKVKYNDAQRFYYILATDEPYNSNAEYCVNFALGDLRLSIKIRQEPIPVTEIVLELLSDKANKVEIDSQTEIATSITPSYATYQALQFSISKIVDPNGIPYMGKYSQYASVYASDVVYLRTTKAIDVGAKIYLWAIAEKDQVRSNELEVTVIRTPITDIDLETNKPDGIKLGDTCWFRPIAYDEHATFNVKGEEFSVTLTTPDLAEMEYSKGIKSYFISPTKNAEIGDVIKVLVTTPEGFTKTFSWSIIDEPVEIIPIEKVVLVNIDTGEELGENVFIAKGGTMHFRVKVFPENATYNKTEFWYATNHSNYFTFLNSEDVLIVKVSEDAKANTMEYIWGRAENGAGSAVSMVYRIYVDRTPVQRITLIPNSKTLVKGQFVEFTYEFFPANSDISLDHVRLTMVEEVKGVEIDRNTRAYIDYTITGGTEIKFKATTHIYAGVESNVVALTVEKVPVKQVALGIDTFKLVKGDIYQLVLRYNAGADAKSVEFKLLDDTQKSVYVSTGNRLVITYMAVTGTKFRLQAVVDGVESNILNLEIVDFAEPDDEIIELEEGVLYHLDRIYYPDTESSVTFIMLDDISMDEVTFVNRLLSENNVDSNINVMLIQLLAKTGMTFKMMAIVDGVADRVFTFRVGEKITQSATTTAIQAEEPKQKHGY